MCSLTDVFMFPVSQMEDGSVQRDFRNTLTLAQVTEALLYFTRSQLDILVRNTHTTLSLDNMSSVVTIQICLEQNKETKLSSYNNIYRYCL